MCSCLRLACIYIPAAFIDTIVLERTLKRVKCVKLCIEPRRHIVLLRWRLIRSPCWPFLLAMSFGDATGQRNSQPERNITHRQTKDGTLFSRCRLWFTEEQTKRRCVFVGFFGAQLTPKGKAENPVGPCFGVVSLVFAVVLEFSCVFAGFRELNRGCQDTTALMVGSQDARDVDQ